MTGWRRAEVAWFFAGRGDDVVVVDSPQNMEMQVHLGPGDDRVMANDPRGRRALGFGSVCVSYAFARHPTPRRSLTRSRARSGQRPVPRCAVCLRKSAPRSHRRDRRAADYIQDGAGALHVVARGGSDYVNGSRHDDLVTLGPGDDTYNGGQGSDRAFGGPGDDALNGDEGVDSLYGGRGDDEVNGAYYCHSNSETFPVSDGSPNELYGGPGDDYLIGDVGNDLLDGGPGTDRGFGQQDGMLDTLVSLETPTACSTRSSGSRPFIWTSLVRRNSAMSVGTTANTHGVLSARGEQPSFGQERGVRAARARP